MFHQSRRPGTPNTGPPDMQPAELTDMPIMSRVMLTGKGRKSSPRVAPTWGWLSSQLWLKREMRVS